MTCCKGTQCCPHTEELKLAAANFDLDPAWVANVIEKFGEAVLPALVEALRNGFSKDVVVQLLERLGPEFVQLLVDIVNQHNMMKPASVGGLVVTGDVAVTNEEMPVVRGAIIQVIIQKYLPIIIEQYGPVLIEQYLPMLLQKYGPQLVQALVDIFTKGVNTTSVAK